MINLGQTRVSLNQRALLRDGVPLPIGARAFDILELLIRHQGRLVTKDQMLQHAWPQTMVEENNVQVHISALRKALGTDRDLIRTIAGRGYVLLGAEAPSRDAIPHDPQCITPPQGEQRLPVSIPLIGRDTLLEDIRQALSESALVTLTGPGGVGKTALATEVAQGFMTTGATRVCVVSLAELNGPTLLMDAVASALGIDCLHADPLPQTLINPLTAQPYLMVLDNCEHVIEAVAAMVENLLRHCPVLRVLATSREPLRIAHERSVRVPALDVPQPGADRRSTLDCASVQLLLSHMRALNGSFAPLHSGESADAEPDTQSLDLMAEVCRRLDGLPLALQMAAPRACGVGLFELLASLEDSMHLLSAGLRTAIPRHQTLQASLIWSLRLLDDEELVVLERLSQLQGRFTLDLACDAVQAGDLSRARLLDCIVGLALKSLLTISAEGPFRFYAVPDATRTFIRCSLQEKQHAPSAAAHTAPSVSALSPARFFTGHSGPPGPNGYHASHQRMLAASR